MRILNWENSYIMNRYNTRDIWKFFSSANKHKLKIIFWFWERQKYCNKNTLNCDRGKSMIFKHFYDNLMRLIYHNSQGEGTDEGIESLFTTFFALALCDAKRLLPSVPKMTEHVFACPQIRFHCCTINISHMNWFCYIQDVNECDSEVIFKSLFN